MGRTMWDPLLFLWTAAACWGSGSFFLRRLGVEPPTFLHRVLFSAGLGFVLLSYGVLALAVVGELRSAAVLVLLAAQTLLGMAEGGPLLGGTRAFLRGRWARDPVVRAALVIAALCSLFILAGALAPPDESDALTYHLPVARAYADGHRLADLTGVIRYSVFPQGMEMLFAVGFSLGEGPVFASLLSALFGALLAITAGALTRELTGNARWAAVAAVLFYSFPSVGVFSAQPLVDAPLAFYVVLGLLAALRWDENRRVAWAVLLSLYCGFAFAIKYTGAVTVFLPAALLLSRRFSRESLRIAPVFLPVFAVLAVPWLVRNALFTGNPVSPFLNGFFHGSNLDPFTEGALREHLASLSRHAVREELAFLRDFFFLHSPAPLLLLPLPFLYRRRPGRPLALALGYGILLYAVFDLFLPKQWRFFLAPLALVTASSFAALPLLGSGKSRLRGAFLAFAIGNALLPNGAITARQARKLPVLYGAETRRDYLARRLDNHAAAEYARRELPRDARILSLNDNRRFYFEREVIVATESPRGAFAYTARSGEEAVRRMREEKMTHLLVNGNPYWEERRRPSVLLGEETLRRFFIPVFEKSGVTLYALRAGAVPTVEGGRAAETTTKPPSP
ncbi:MAG: phospholipid carrier-dependent glycosyltransferase [Candidatus Eisenbacteria bacterium]|nr:phospholipid carrier-dependent glycosyltransferase [Candidatus Eisenbacteria bacterium]